MAHERRKPEAPGRTPPAEVRERLRREVNFGCPMPGCGSPFLSWHHFDPPWREEKHHRPEGMIALCFQHAAFADGGNYPRKRLRELKRAPFVQVLVNDRLPWEPENVTIAIGGSIAFGPRRALSLRGTDLFTVRRLDVGRLSIDAILLDPRGRPVLSMQDNEFTVCVPELDDFECTVRGKDIKVKHRSGVRLALRFEVLTKDQFAARLPKHGNVVDFAAAHACDSDGNIPIISVTGHLFVRGYQLRLSPDGLDLLGAASSTDDPFKFAPVFFPGASLTFQTKDPRNGVTSPILSLG